MGSLSKTTGGRELPSRFVAGVPWRLPDVSAAYVVLFVSLTAGALLRAWLALTDDGIYWPDEVYQSFEPAHWLVYGYGLIPWEFVDGMRNWTFSAFVAVWLKLSQLAGIDDPRFYITLVKLVFSAISVACAGGAYLLARAYGAATLSAATGAALYALWAPFLYFGPRAMSESAAALPVVLGFALALHPDASRGRTVAGASLLGLAVLLRLHAGVFAVALVAILLARGRVGRSLDALGALAVFALLFGFIDHLTWAHAPGARFDGWFHSALTYLRFNLIEGKASGWGTSPWSYYLTTLWRAAPAVMLLVVGLSLMALPRAAGLWVTTVFSSPARGCASQGAALCRAGDPAAVRAGRDRAGRVRATSSPTRADRCAPRGRRVVGRDLSSADVRGRGPVSRPGGRQRVGRLGANQPAPDGRARAARTVRRAGRCRGLGLDRRLHLPASPRAAVQSRPGAHQHRMDKSHHCASRRRPPGQGGRCRGSVRFDRAGSPTLCRAAGLPVEALTELQRFIGEHPCDRLG